eukprot:8546751-Heterocapsa_arctica.AAC.1
MAACPLGRLAAEAASLPGCLAAWPSRLAPERATSSPTRSTTTTTLSIPSGIPLATTARGGGGLLRAHPGAALRS